MDKRSNDQGNKALSKRIFPWMVLFLVFVACGAAGVLAYFEFFPETVVEAPSAPKPPMHNAPN